ncbi:DNA translocase FtsK [Alkalicoccus luteus]|uniref:DNA translocase FtsK n=1 Tax=Alkalicoccus luteus TaxID=1237094 RepID=A0A969PN19_9BACI|nr:DNA translocase FtsK [Alkalicoccus luteus]NJP36298.1 DNA translocase FtsK [Alkalicoccus luteus]
MPAKKKKKPTKKEQQWKRLLKFEASGALLAITAVLIIFRLGWIGEIGQNALRFAAGSLYWLPAAALLLSGLFLMWKRKFPHLLSRTTTGILLAAAGCTSLLQIPFRRRYAEGVQQGIAEQSASFGQIEGFHGGVSGVLIFESTAVLAAAPGAIMLALLLVAAGAVIASRKSIIDMMKWSAEKQKPFAVTFWKKLKLAGVTIAESVKQRFQERQTKENTKIETDEPAPISGTDKAEEVPEELNQPVEKEPLIYDFTATAYEEPQHQVEKKEAEQGEAEPVESKRQGLVVQESENVDYKLPSVSLLAPPSKQTQSKEHSQLSKNARKLEDTLASFGVSAKVTKVHLGPAVTKYEVYPATGVKVSRIVNLSDDLALALAAKDIRMEAPIPGKSAIGIEVPNQDVALVTFREVIDSQQMKNEANPLAIALGRNISGEAVAAHLNKMPHLLVAGATGSGKSVCINGIIVSILLRSKPHEVKLMMIDPKMVELNVYNGIPHLLSPVVTEPKKAAQALKKVVSEMERRYELFAATGTRNIEGYNQHIHRENETREDPYSPLPYIVVLVDELADLMMVASGDVEDAITRLAQMARAAGIHLIIATQRPSVDVITGVIKANIPSRIAFGVSSSTDSRTILDGAGAEKLLGKGDMLFMPVGSGKPVRIQGAFLSDEEVEKVVRHCIEQQQAQYSEEMIPDDEPETTSAESDDALFPDAVALVTEMQTASVSMLQRRFRVGYARAARLIDEMEQQGIVGPYEGSKPREVLAARGEDGQSN